VLSPISIQTQSLALRALRKRKPQETQALAVFVYATHSTQAFAFEWKPGFSSVKYYVMLCVLISRIHIV